MASIPGHKKSKNGNYLFLLFFMVVIPLAEGREQRSADRFAAGPGDHGQDEYEGDGEEDQGQLLLFSVGVSLFDLGAADVYQGDGYYSEEGVLYGEEAQYLIAHGGAHIGEGRLGEGAGEHEHKTYEQLDIQEDHEKEACLGVCCAVGLFAGNAHDGAEYGEDAYDEDQPAHVRVNVYQNLHIV
jgi:hypothetical protein